jgi:hypothetical protein
MRADSYINPETTLEQKFQAAQERKVIFQNESIELNAANTIFASTSQKEYINAAMQVNQDNIKISDLILNVSLSNLDESIIKINETIFNRSVYTSNEKELTNAHPGVWF